MIKLLRGEKMNQFYCLKTCSTCKKAQKFLEENNISYQVIDIKTYHFTRSDIELIHQKSGKEIKKLFNTSGKLYRELNLKDKIKTMNLNEIYDLLASDGMLIKRPILITKDKVYVGFKEEEYKELIK